MKKMKLFPKTFLYTFFMLLIVSLSMHLMIYFFYPKVYLSRVQQGLEERIDVLGTEIAACEEDETGTILSEFAKSNQVNVTVETDAGEETYQGMSYGLLLDTDSDIVFSINNLGDEQSIIVKNRTLKKADGTDLKIQVIESAKPLYEAMKIIQFLLPYTFGATILFSVVFSYFYSKKITDPILTMLKVTADPA